MKLRKGHIVAILLLLWLVLLVIAKNFEKSSAIGLFAGALILIVTQYKTTLANAKKEKILFEKVTRNLKKELSQNRIFTEELQIKIHSLKGEENKA